MGGELLLEGRSEQDLPGYHINYIRFLFLDVIALKNQKFGAGPVAEWLSSHTPLLAAQCFVGSNPGLRHGTAHQTTLRQHPMYHG